MFSYIINGAALHVYVLGVIMLSWGVCNIANPCKTPNPNICVCKKIQLMFISQSIFDVYLTLLENQIVHPLARVGLRVSTCPAILEKYINAQIDGFYIYRSSAFFCSFQIAWGMHHARPPRRACGLSNMCDIWFKFYKYLFSTIVCGLNGTSRQRHGSYRASIGGCMVNSSEGTPGQTVNLCSFRSKFNVSTKIAGARINLFQCRNRNHKQSFLKLMQRHHRANLRPRLNISLWRNPFRRTMQWFLRYLVVVDVPGFWLDMIFAFVGTTFEFCGSAHIFQLAPCEDIASIWEYWWHLVCGSSWGCVKEEIFY